MAVYNVDKIDDWYDDFVSLKNKFNNTYYSDYKSSYIKSCSDSAVKNMKSSLNEHYSKIKKMYNNINTAWNSYLQDLKNTDKRLAGNKVGINASSVSTKLANLPVLQEYKQSLEIKIKSVSAVVGTAKGIGWSEDKTIDQNLEYLENKVGATITTATVSLVEGLGLFAEGLVDVAAITTTGIATIIAYATSDVDEAKKISDQNWEDCRTFTSKQYVRSAFDSFYENTDVGKSLKKDSYAFDVVRSVGNEVGEVLGAVGISVATGGVINPAILYGTSKAGTHVEENWQDENTSTAAGLVKGTLQGIGDGIFFGLGMKGDAVMKSAAINAVKKGGQQALKKTAILTGKTLFECGCSVAQDGSNILINAIFSDDIVKSQDGKDVKLNSFGDKLNYYYNQAGGMEGLMTSMATASVLSFASDFVDVSKVGKNIDTNAAIRNTDINANNMKNTIEGVNPKNIEVSTKPTKSDINLDSLKKEYDDLINWKNSDEGLYSKRLNEVYGDRFGSNSRYKKNMARIAELETRLFNNNSDQLIKNANNTKVNISSNSNISQLTREYDELLKKSKESWFVQAKEASDNGWAWDLNKVNEADNIVKRMQELESTLGIKNKGVPESKIYDYSQAKKEADTMVQKMKNEPIPALEKYKVDPKSLEYQKALKKYYSKLSPSGKQDLSHIENPINLKNTDLNKNITSRTINSNLSKMQSLPKTLAGIFASVPAAITKMKNVDITPGSKIFKKIQSEGLYHFTDEVSAKKILDSGYIKESSNFTSYGKKRTFLFAGVPTVEDTCLNSVFDYKKTAVKLHPSDAEISGLQYRKYSDSAVSSIGNYDITNSSPEIAYLVLKEQDGVLKYVEVPKAEYDNYNPHFNDNVINKTVENAKKNIYQTTVGISAEYDNVVKGVKQYAGDLKDKLAPKKVFADYDGNLKEYIFDNIPNNLNAVEKARYIYCKLNNEVSYSKLWNSTKKVSGIDTDAVYNQKINIESFLGQEIVCSNWSEMYHELLDIAGVENYIRGIGGIHKWVVFTENGKYYMADATNNFNRAHDLARMQGNVQSGGFFEITKEQFYSDTFANELANKKKFNGLYEKTLSDSNLNLKKIDKKLGFNYEDSEKLFGEGLHQGNSSKELKHLGLNKNSSMAEIINAKLEKELFNKINNMGVLEAYGYTNIVKNRFFTGMEQGKLRCTLVADAVTGEESIMYRVINGKNYLYNGKGVFVEIDNDFAINYENHGYVKIAGN